MVLSVCQIAKMFYVFFKANMKKTCAYKDFLGNSCSHDCFPGHDCCIFHLNEVLEKAQPFQDALMAYMERVESSSEIKSYLFNGFVFPDIDLSNQIVTKPAHFSGAQFLGEAFFLATQFTSNTSFYRTRFTRPVSFDKVKFTGEVSFREARFLGSTSFREAHFVEESDFDSVEFLGEVDFYRTRFTKEAYFHEVQFSGPLTFHETRFFQDVYFNEAHFFECAHFEESLFLKRAEFKGSVFHDEVNFNRTKFSLLKRVNAQKCSLYGAILESAALWGTETLQRYSFQNAFLLSVSLAHKKLLDCNFTGATFDGVSLRGWQPDKQTLENTKYIYTDYMIETIADDDDHLHTVYRPVPDSRIPLTGNFGEGEYQGFYITDYFKGRDKTLSLPSDPSPSEAEVYREQEEFQATLKRHEEKLTSQWLSDLIGKMASLRATFRFASQENIMTLTILADNYTHQQHLKTEADSLAGLLKTHNPKLAVEVVINPDKQNLKDEKQRQIDFIQQLHQDLTTLDNSLVIALPKQNDC